MKMDTSKEYIEMSKRAVEVQGLWEQLWLAFVMHEKYGKKWDGNDWI